VWRNAIDSGDRRWLGPGSTIPGELRSEGAIELTIAGRSACVLLQTTA
jgi:hypothetical protein